MEISPRRGTKDGSKGSRRYFFLQMPDGYELLPLSDFQVLSVPAVPPPVVRSAQSYGGPFPRKSLLVIEFPVLLPWMTMPREAFPFAVLFLIVEFTSPVSAALMPMSSPFFSVLLRI